MADTSPGKVQALRAMFSQKDAPVMGLMPSNGKLGTRPWKSSTASLADEKSFKEQPAVPPPISAAATRAILKTLQESSLSKENVNTSDTICDKLVRKPPVGPKPLLSSQQHPQSVSSSALKTSRPYENSVLQHNRTNSEDLGCRKNYDTIASFMFAERSNSVDATGVPELRCPEDLELKIKKDMLLNSHLVNSDNYICKSRCGIMRNELPPKDKFRPPPLKPPRPTYLKLPDMFAAEKTNDNFPLRTALLPPSRPVSSSGSFTIPPKPTYPCPPRPTTSPPVPPTSANPLFETRPSSKSLLEEIEELYEDTLMHESGVRPVSLIPEYTAEEEESELYDDADHVRNSITDACPMRPKYPPPPLPSTYLSHVGSPITEELYQDAIEPITDEVYEEMPVDLQEEDHYSNNKKEFEKMKREEEKRLKKELKEKEKKEKLLDKVRKKFGLIGDEEPIDKGLVKADSRGGRGDLPVKKGDIVYILRIESNPAGRWLVRNSKGKYGYVELTNIEVDPDSVKSVMTIRRTSVISNSDELYSEAYSEEGIYEVTY